MQELQLREANMSDIIENNYLVSDGETLAPKWTTPNEWIKCSDRIPEKNGRYLVLEGGSYTWIGVSSLRNGRWDSENTTHWMSLPEPPKD